MPDDRKNRILGDAHGRLPALRIRPPLPRRDLDGGRRRRARTAAPPLVKECRACGEPLESAMQVDCRACGAPLRDAELFGVPIRRKPEPKRAAPVFDDD